MVEEEHDEAQEDVNWVWNEVEEEEQRILFFGNMEERKEDVKRQVGAKTSLT